MVTAANACSSRPVKKRFNAFFGNFLFGFRGQSAGFGEVHPLLPPG
jgi:hypothetical protein